MEIEMIFKQKFWRIKNWQLNSYLQVSYRYDGKLERQRPFHLLRSELSFQFGKYLIGQKIEYEENYRNMF